MNKVVELCIFHIFENVIIVLGHTSSMISFYSDYYEGMFNFSQVFSYLVRNHLAFSPLNFINVIYECRCFIIIASLK